jgi:sec-independent protein translocase protein TatA
MFGLGITEMVVIFGALLLLFGGRKLPELATGLGEGIRNFKKAMNEDPTPKQEKIAQIEEASKK